MLNKKKEKLEICKDPKKSLSNFRVWAQTKDLLTDDLMEHTDKEMQSIRNSTVSLCEDDKAMLTSSKMKPRNPLFIHSQSMANLNSVSHTSQRMLHDAYTTIKSIRNSTNEIIQLNSLYFSHLGSPKSTDHTNTQATMTPSHKGALPKIMQAQTPAQTPKSKIANFHYAANNFRKQLNRAFMKFNPLIHLENMKLLQQADPDIKEDIDHLKDVIAQDLEEITDKHYHRNRYLEFIRKKKLTLSPLSPTDCIIEVEESKLKNITTRNTRKKTTLSVPHLFKTKNSNFTETRRKFPFKEQRMNEMENMQSSLRLLSEIVSDENIGRSIKEHIREKKLELEHSEPYKYQLEFVEESLKENHKMKLRNVKEGNALLNKVKRDNELYLKKLPCMKSALLQDIDKITS